MYLKFKKLGYNPSMSQQPFGVKFFNDDDYLYYYTSYNIYKYDKNLNYINTFSSNVTDPYGGKWNSTNYHNYNGKVRLIIPNNDYTASVLVYELQGETWKLLGQSNVYSKDTDGFWFRNCSNGILKDDYLYFQGLDNGKIIKMNVNTFEAEVFSDDNIATSYSSTSTLSDMNALVASKYDDSGIYFFQYDKTDILKIDWNGKASLIPIDLPSDYITPNTRPAFFGDNGRYLLLANYSNYKDGQFYLDTTTGDVKKNYFSIKTSSENIVTIDNNLYKIGLNNVECYRVDVKDTEFTYKYKYHSNLNYTAFPAFMYRGGVHDGKYYITSGLILHEFDIESGVRNQLYLDENREHFLTTTGRMLSCNGELYYYGADSSKIRITKISDMSTTDIPITATDSWQFINCSYDSKTNTIWSFDLKNQNRFIKLNMSDLTIDEVAFTKKSSFSNQSVMSNYISTTFGDGKIYIIGQRYLYVYDTLSNTMSSLSTNLITDTLYYVTALTYSKGYLYIFGNGNFDGATSYWYNQQSDDAMYKINVLDGSCEIIDTLIYNNDTLLSGANYVLGADYDYTNDRLIGFASNYAYTSGNNNSIVLGCPFTYNLGGGEPTEPEESKPEDIYTSENRYIRPKIVVHYPTGSITYQDSELIDYYAENPYVKNSNPLTRINTGSLDFSIDDIERKLLPSNNLDKFVKNLKVELFTVIYDYEKEEDVETLVNTYYTYSFSYDNNNNILDVTAIDKLYLIGLIKSPLSSIYYDITSYNLIEELMRLIGVDSKSFKISEEFKNQRISKGYFIGETVIEILENMSDSLSLECYCLDDVIYFNDTSSLMYDQNIDNPYLVTNESNLSLLDVNRNIGTLYKDCIVKFNTYKSLSYENNDVIFNGELLKEYENDGKFEIRFDDVVEYITSIEYFKNIKGYTIYQNGIELDLDTTNLSDSSSIPVTIKGLKLSKSEFNHKVINIGITSNDSLVIKNYMLTDKGKLTVIGQKALVQSNNPNDTMNFTILYNPYIKLGRIIKLTYEQEGFKDKLFRVIGVSANYSGGFEMKIVCKEVYNG